MAFYTNVPTNITKEDSSIFAQLDLNQTRSSLTFDEQIKIFSRVQAEVFKRAPLGDGIDLFQAREPADLMRAGQGLCYDRSRTFDKAMSYLGYQSRHVYMLYRQDKSFLRALITYGQASHAVTEVKTSKGWMLVDSNTAWLAVTRNGEPVGAGDVWLRFSEFENPPEYFKDPYWAIRGMYSRNGKLYSPYVPFPDLNWPDFLRWMVWE